VLPPAGFFFNQQLWSFYEDYQQHLDSATAYRCQQSRESEKKAELVEQLDRAFADPAKHGQTPEQVEKLKTWLPAGMAFAVAAMPAPAKAKKAA